MVVDSSSGCWGLAYSVTDEDWPEIRAQLDYREKDGYQLQSVRAQADGREFSCWTYVADALNPSYVGERPSHELSWRISRARGESGANIDYLLRLHARLSELGIEDLHVKELVELLPPS